MYLLWSIKGNAYCFDPFVEGSWQKQMCYKSNTNLKVHAKT